MEIQVEYRSPAGRTRREEPARLCGVPLEERGALSEPRAYRGRRSKLTKWVAATTGAGVWCVNTVQMDAAMLLDADPDIEWFQSRAVRVHFEDGAGGRGSIEPAFFARTRAGERLAIMHPPREAAGVEERVMEQAAAEAGWQVRALRVPQGVLRSSLQGIAHFRAPEFAADADARRVLLETFATPRPLQAGASASGLGLKAAGYAWHLLWTGALTCNWGQPLLPTSLVWDSGGPNGEESVE